VACVLLHLSAVPVHAGQLEPGQNLDF
jgi:hypothetical protein